MLDDRSPRDRDELIAVIGQVRRRWRRKLALRGAAFVVGIAGVTLLASAWGLEVFRFRPAAIVMFRLLTLGVLGASAWVFCVRPLLRRVTDEQVALYLEEREPSLDAALMSAVEASGGTPAPATDSAALIGKLIESALERSASVDHGQRVERSSTQRFGVVLGAIAAVLVAAIALGPAYLRHGLKALFVISRSVEASSPYRIEVQPGNATVPRGADQAIAARLVGFSAAQVELLYRTAPGASLERLPLMAAKNPGEYEGMLIDLAASLEYFVESNGVSSPVFTLKVADLPYVKRLDLEYVFPKYTGLEPRKAEDAGDIAAPRGTEMRVRIVPTMKTQGGSLKINDSTVVPLTPNADGTLSGTFTVDRPGFYRVELEAPSGEHVAASPQYTIDILNDQAPRVSIVKPGRDSTVTPLQEVFLQARADDDFGVRSLELVLSVNGGPQKAVRLFGGGGSPRQEVTAGQTLYLEELRVKPGDAVSYFARATDNDSVAGSKNATSDMYFLRVGPFEKDFRPAQSNAGGGGGGMGGAGGEVGALSQQQKQIVVATFNILRDKDKTPAPKYRESVTLITLAQARLREQVEGLVGRMNSRLVEPDPSFKKIADVLPQAATQMRAAEEQLKALKAGEALPPEQRALNFLQQAEEEYQLQVAMNRGGGGGGGGGQPGSIAEDLADLFKLELDKLANQYETLQRAGQQAGDQQVDELMERLRELARRQEQEAERQRQAAARAGASSPSARAGQRELAEQAEESARRLERLSRELQRPDLADAAQRMREAADAMRRAAAGQAGASAEANAAARRLRDVEDRLRRDRAAGAERDIRDAQRRADELARAQRDIAGEVPRVGQESGAARQDRIRGLMQRKEAVQGKTADLEKQLDRSALELRRDEKEAARKLQEGADAMRAGKVRDKMRYAGQLLQGGQPEYARTFEEDAAATLEALQKKLGEAASALGATGQADRKTDTLERAGNLVRGMESLTERMRERGQQGRGGQNQQSGQANGRQGGGQQSDPSQSGGRTADGRGGSGDTFGPWGPGGAYGSRRPWGWGYSPEDIRQFRREIQEWSGDAQALRRRLLDEGVNPAELDTILKALRALDAERVYADAEALQRLQTFVLEGLKRFEFKVRRQLGDDLNQPLLSESDEVPDGFRDLVEEYYRALSRSQAQRGAGVKKPK
jgi:hypothetical protein